MRWISAIVGVSLLVAGLGTAAEAGPVAPAAGDGVFRHYGAPGGLKDEFEQLAAEHPGITKLVTIGRTVQGEDIIAPGPIDRPLFGKLGLPAEQVHAMAAGIVSQIPLARFGNAEEVAETVLFLASDDSTFILGEEIIIDGGMATL